MPRIINAGFERGNLTGWNDWRRKQAKLTTESHSGHHAVELGPGRGQVAQQVSILPNRRYRLSAYVRTDSAAGEVQLIASDYGGVTQSVSSALTEYTEVGLDFESAGTVDTVLVMLRVTSGTWKGFADDITITDLGPASPPVVQEFIVPEPRVLLSEGGVTQQPDETSEWFLNDKFGMFIHWGVYSAMDEGNEWVMHNKAYSPEYYRDRAEDPESGFTADRFHPDNWVELAKTAGMRYMVLTARHHDGYALFESQHENSWTSVQHLGRDLIDEYVAAVRRGGLGVGLYYSPMSWRYPGYYDVRGTGAKPNVWNYATDPGNKENARLMKEEVYEQVTTLLSNYGPIAYMFWDGGWLGQSVDAELEDNFWDSGRFQSPDTEWPIDERYHTTDGDTGRPLGIMGLVRRFQPEMLVNERFGWIGDVHGEEGVSPTAGPIRSAQITEKCMPLLRGGWGYWPNRPVISSDEVAVYLSDCVVRNVNLLLNVSPDRHGEISDHQREVLRDVGAWLERVGDAVYNTRGGPWQPRFGEYGFTYKANTIYCHVYAGYPHTKTGTFTTQSLGDRRVESVHDLYTGTPLAWSRNDDSTITIRDVDYSVFQPVTILEVTLDDDVYAP